MSGRHQADSSTDSPCNNYISVCKSKVIGRFGFVVYSRCHTDIEISKLSVVRILQLMSTCLSKLATHLFTDYVGELVKFVMLSDGSDPSLLPCLLLTAHSRGSGCQDSTLFRDSKPLVSDYV